MGWRAKLTCYLSALWYRQPMPWGLKLLLPLAILFQQGVRLRRQYYRWLAPAPLPVPVIVVGNLTVGGTGKTPIVATLATQLTQQGYQVGILSRGYSGSYSTAQPYLVKTHNTAQEVGEEPLWLAQTTACPVMIGRKRAKAGRELIKLFPQLQLLIADDGLQHYALARQCEILVLDGQRRLGNGCCLPAGPLREPSRRAQYAEFILCHNGPAKAGEMAVMSQLATYAYQLNQPSEQRRLIEFHSQPVVAMAGIAQPQRYFSMLRQAGFTVIPCPLADHHKFQAQDFIPFKQQLIMMTEKDAIKCQAFNLPNAWVIPLVLDLPPLLLPKLMEKINGP